MGHLRFYETFQMVLCVRSGYRPTKRRPGSILFHEGRHLYIIEVPEIPSQNLEDRNMPKFFNLLSQSNVILPGILTKVLTPNLKLCGKDPYVQYKNLLSILN